MPLGEISVLDEILTIISLTLRLISLWASSLTSSRYDYLLYLCALI